VHRLPPHVKVVAAFTAVLVVASTPPEAWWVFVLDAAALLVLARVARVPYRFVAARLLVITPFLIVAVMLPFVAAGERVEVLGVPVSVDGLVGAWNIAAKASLGAATSILLAATTEVPRLLRGLERLRVPPVLTQIATFMVRYLEIVTGEVGRMRTAMTARGYDPRWLWQARPIGAAAGSLFVRSYERGERVHAAMLARGYTGTMPPLDDDRPASPREWLTGALFPTFALATSSIWWLVS
jgi:cobalt/nickel transport system permease protein